jgi:small subunit ribosomal protein S17
MSEEEKTEPEATEPEATEEAPAEEPAAEAPAEEPAAQEAPEEPAAEEAPAEEPAEEEAPAEEPAAEEAPAEEPAEEPAAAAEPAEEAEPEEVVSQKERRKRERAVHSGEAAPPRSVDERIAERAAARRAKAAERRRTRARSRSKHEAGEGTPPAEREPGAKKVRQGTVVSSKADKTITVKIEVVRRHPVYEKVVRRSATVHAHDETNEANAGDVVRVIESRPLSRTKRWRLVEVLEKAR